MPRRISTVQDWSRADAAVPGCRLLAAKLPAPDNIFDSRDSGLLDLRMCRQTQVIVRREHDDAAFAYITRPHARFQSPAGFDVNHGLPPKSGTKMS